MQAKPSTSQNPQRNGVIKRVHATIHNMLRTFDLQLQTFDPNKPWQGFLASIADAVCSKFHTTLCATPAELVFGRNMLFS